MRACLLVVLLFIGATGIGLLVGAPPVASESSARLIDSFAGISFDGQIQLDQTLAAGPNSVLVANSGGVMLLRKSGGKIVSERPLTLFASVLQRDEMPFDPRVLFDPISARF